MVYVSRRLRDPHILATTMHETHTMQPREPIPRRSLTAHLTSKLTNRPRLPTLVQQQAKDGLIDHALLLRRRRDTLTQHEKVHLSVPRSRDRYRCRRDQFQRWPDGRLP